MSTKLKMTKDLFDLLMMDLPLRPAMVVDFGIETNGHHACLQTLVRRGASIDELDDALGNGDKLNDLVAKYGINTECIFKTPYDKVRNAVAKQINALRTKNSLTNEEEQLLQTLQESYDKL